LASIVLTTRSPEAAGWRAAGLRYHSLGFFYRQQFGCRVWKVSVDGGFSCPNRDGTLGFGGCVFCDSESFSPSRRMSGKTIVEQINSGALRLSGRYRADKLVAYFQPATNTYGPVEQLRSGYAEALSHPLVAGLAVGTRPDCMADEALDLLAELAGRTWVSVEYGLQSIHDRTLAWLGRGHDYVAFLDSVQRTRSRGTGIGIGAHVILGLPGESADDMRATARELARLDIDSVKIHNLYAVKNTRLAEMVAAGRVRLPELQEYAGWVVDFLEILPPRCVIDRLSGDAPPEYLVGPDWCRNKSAARAAIDAELRRRDTWQGRLFGV
jgi:uncharacterized protein